MRAEEEQTNSMNSLKAARSYADRDSVPGDNGIAQYLSCFERIIMPVWVFDIDLGRVYWANEAALKLWRTSSLDELRERDMSGEMSPTVAQRLKQYQEDFKDNASFTELWTLYPNGEPATMRCIFSGIELDDSRMAMFCQALEEPVETPETLRSAQALMHTTVMISLYTPEGGQVYHNPAARAVKCTDCHLLADQFVQKADFDALHRMLKLDGMASIVAQVKTAQGIRWHEINARESRDAVTGSPAILISEVDISDLKETEQTANFLALHDVLTGLPNRTYLQRIIAQKFAAAEALDRKLGLLFIDLDHFKRINDSLGHAVGDKLLIEVAQRLKQCSRPNDIIVRLGGDEFVVLLDDGSERSVITGMANRIQEVLGDPITINKNELRISPSIGISVFPDDGNNLDVLMQNADLAMYEAKDCGRNRHCFFASYMKERAETRMVMESSLRRAVDNGEFELFYQPQVSFAENKVVGAEALLRWQHPTRGLLGPGEFIGLAEESGLIEPIGEWVILEAARQQSEWQADGNDISVSVNLSPRQFRSPALIPTIEKVALAEGFDPSRLDLEITESMLMGDNNEIIRELQKIHDMGFNLAIDDFGTGYSNLSYLQRYPISCLKIDRSFIVDLRKTSAITELIISMCKILDVTIVAEGVENLHQLEWLKDKNCHKYQGYFFSKPVSAPDFLPFFEKSEVATGNVYEFQPRATVAAN